MQDHRAEEQLAAAGNAGQDRAGRSDGTTPGVVNVRQFRNEAPCGCLELTEQENKQSFTLYLHLLGETLPEVTAERQAIWTDLSFHQLSALLVAAALPVDGTAPCPRLGSGRAFVQDVLSQELYPKGSVDTGVFQGSGNATPDNQLIWFALRAVDNYKTKLLDAMRVATQAARDAGAALPVAAAAAATAPPRESSEVTTGSVGTRSNSEQSASRVPDAIQASASAMLDDSAQARATAHFANRERNQQLTDEGMKPYMVSDAELRDMVQVCGLGASVDCSGRVSIGTGYWIAAQAELMAQRSVHAWETRFLFFTAMMFIFVFTGAQYALRTTQPALCPFGSAQQPSTWYFDECVGGESQTA